MRVADLKAYLATAPDHLEVFITTASGKQYNLKPGSVTDRHGFYLEVKQQVEPEVDF